MFRLKTNYQLANVVFSNWVQGRSLSNGRCLVTTLMLKSNQNFPIYKFPATQVLPYASRTYYSTPPQETFFVYMNYENSNKVAIFYNEVIVIESHANTSFWACGFNGGQFGLQELENGERFIKFAYRPDSYEDTQKKLQIIPTEIGSDIENLEVIKSSPWYNLNSYPLLVAMLEEPNDKTRCILSVYNHELQEWSIIRYYILKRQNFLLNGCYSSIEVMNPKTGPMARSARFDPWVRDTKGNWYQPAIATFTREGTNNYGNAWTQDSYFFLKTGGYTSRISDVGQRFERDTLAELPKRLINVENIIIDLIEQEK